MTKEKIKTGGGLIMILLGVLDAGNLIKLGTFHGLLFFIAVILMAEMGISFLYQKKAQKELKFLKKLLLILAVIEATIFQFNSYHLLIGNYPELTLNLNAAKITNFDKNSHENISSGVTSFEFTGINTPIGTLTFEAESSVKDQAAFYVAMSDDSHSASLRNNAANAVVLKNNIRSQTVPCNFSGNVHDMVINFYTDEGEYIHLDKIIINKPIYFHVSWLRFFIFLSIAMAVYILNESEILKHTYAEKKKLVHVTAAVFTIVLIISGLWVTQLARRHNGYGSIADDFRSEGGNQISQEIVDAFEAGHTYLNIEASEELLALENPYDGSQREAAGIGYPWDHLLYNGKIYSYYGIAPVILLFLPYHLLTGYYFPAVWAVYLFCCIGVIFMTKFYLCFIEKFFSQIRASLALTGLFLIQLTCGIWYCFGTALFYEIAQSSGFAMIMPGVYFLLRSDIMGNGKVKHGSLALSSIFMSLSVLCRPTLAVYCICAMIPIFGGFLKRRKEKMPIFTKQTIFYFLCALLPYMIIGGAQMIYNYVRFGSITDFGIDYSLTINDFTSAQYHTHFVLIGAFSYLFQFPIFIERFPFFYPGSAYQFNPQGFYFIATGASFGLLWRAPQLLAYAKAKQAYQLSKHPDKILYFLTVLFVSILAPSAILISIWESGYGARYSVDFAWQILIGAFVICFLIYQHCQKNTQNLLNKIMTASCVTSLILFIGQLYAWFGSGFALEFQSFARLFEFWI